MKLIALIALWGPARLPHNEGDVFEAEEDVAKDLISRKLATPAADDEPTTESLVKAAQQALALKEAVQGMKPAFELFLSDKKKFEELAAAYAAELKAKEAAAKELAAAEAAELKANEAPAKEDTAETVAPTTNKK